VALVEETQFFVYVNGKDVSNRWASRLIQLNVTDQSGETADSCRVCLDDKGGTIVMPKHGAPIKIALGPKSGKAEVVFDGLVDDVQSEGSRRGGTVLWIDGKSIDTAGEAKVKKSKWWDNKTIGEAMKDAAEEAGIQLTVAPRIDQLKRLYIAQDHESALHFIQRLAREVGGTFKVIGGKKAVVLDRNQGQTAGGGNSSSVTCTSGDDGNIITWQISPLITRPRYKDITARWYDKEAAKYREQRAKVPQEQEQGGTETGGGGTTGGGGDLGELEDLPDDGVRFTKDDEDVADQAAEGGAKESDRQKGIGNVMIDGNAAPKAEGKCIIKGTRPGIDGTYVIDSVLHELNKHDGWTTTISLVRPQPTGGGDNREESGGVPPNTGDTGQIPDLPD
jgi:phage protein D